MGSRILVALGVLGFLGAALGVAYTHWPLLSFDDGPFLSEPFEGDTLALPLHAETPLRRFGRHVHTLEVRLVDGDTPESVFVLRAPDGSVRWARRPLHPGPLGPIRVGFRDASLTWWLGWAVPIDPAYQEGGVLYLGPCGGFLRFTHSW